MILERGMEDALERARAFVKAGADGIMIHSRRKEPDEIIEFCDKFRAEDKKTPIVVYQIFMGIWWLSKVLYWICNSLIFGG